MWYDISILQRGPCQAGSVAPGPLFVSTQTWSQSMEICDSHSQGREGNGNQMVGISAGAMMSGRMLIAQVRAWQWLPNPSNLGHLPACSLS